MESLGTTVTVGGAAGAGAGGAEGASGDAGAGEEEGCAIESDAAPEGRAAAGEAVLVESVLPDAGSGAGPPSALAGALLIRYS